ncbi:hypothetical protein [Phorcysia thermohydrogeniphila]|uniref:Carbonic anhydrase n=1 Tax=Phorcysia thermohydrogeniphila TaxID=936138 RepID=A0A4R1G9N6_9BACT|nr:hypothetical protein [Phorcysia thermohydrogeniphila]TCK03361.1 carbonic anhydrase [Phorcysia thermohydrogeniphila]
MEAIKVIEKLLVRDCVVKEKAGRCDCCIVCASSMVWRLVLLFPESYIVSNAAAQVFPNLTSIYYAVRDLHVPVVAVTGSTAVNLEKFVGFDFQAAEVEFKLLRKIYEENVDILFPLYEGDSKSLNAALMEINIDVQIEKLLSIPEFESLVSKGELYLCGLVLDETKVYGEKVAFYLINFNGVKDPEEIRNHDLLEEIPEAIRKQKVKRIHVQF